LFLDIDDKPPLSSLAKRFANTILNFGALLLHSAPHEGLGGFPRPNFGSWLLGSDERVQVFSPAGDRPAIIMTVNLGKASRKNIFQQMLVSEQRFGKQYPETVSITRPTIAVRTQEEVFSPPASRRGRNKGQQIAFPMLISDLFPDIPPPKNDEQIVALTYKVPMKYFSEDKASAKVFAVAIGLPESTAKEFIQGLNEDFNLLHLVLHFFLSPTYGKNVLPLLQRNIGALIYVIEILLANLSATSQNHLMRRFLSDKKA